MNIRLKTLTERYLLCGRVWLAKTGLKPMRVRKAVALSQFHRRGLDGFPVVSLFASKLQLTVDQTAAYENASYGAELANRTNRHPNDGVG